MDKLEQYLDRVCLSIGGPKALRQHVRQELREHLLDARAQHKAAGLAEAAALDRALGDFGGPEDVRSELEAAHGHRLLPVVIDKAMQWKEKTMKAKWLWLSWAYLGLAMVVAMEVLFIVFISLFIIPKFQRLTRDGLIDPTILDEQGTSWMPAFLDGLLGAVGNVPIWYVIVPAAAWGLFEWRVRSDNKPFMRLSALGTAAAGLMVVVCLAAGSLVISFSLGVPATGRLAKPFALDQIARIDTSVAGLEQALAKKDWEAMQEQADRASQALDNLAKIGPVVPALTARSEPAQVNELRAQVKAARESLVEVKQAIREKDASKLEATLKQFHEAYGPVQAAAKKAVG